MQSNRNRGIALAAWLGALLSIAALAALLVGPGVAAHPAAKPKPPGQPAHPLTSQMIYGYPLTITVEDDTQMDIRYRDPTQNQFYGNDAEGVYLWLNIGGTVTVYGPPHVPAGNDANPYTQVSNVLTGVGSPSNPWLVTTVNDVPGTNVRLVQQMTYVNGAEFADLAFTVQQIGGTQPITATLFHAADLYTNGSDQGFGYYDPATGGVGDYYTGTNNLLLYQEFVPKAGYPATAYEESYYSTIWANIGSTAGPGTGFDNTIISDTLHDSGTGLQWNLIVPPNGSAYVADTDLFSPHASLCGSFSDVPYGSFYYDYIYYLACHGIVSGYNDTTFRPGSNTTRGQLAKIAANSAGFSEPPTGQMFQDVPTTQPFYTYIQRIASRGLISGYNCGGPNEPCVAPNNLPYFRPGADVTRGQLTKIIANTAGFADPVTTQTFADVPPSNPFYLYAERMATRGLISGYTCGGPNEPCDPQSRPYLRPGNPATRGQISKIDKLTFFPTLR